MAAKVSMVMPCYNKVKHIGNMLRSVHAQTWDDVQLILVNDGATDGSRGVIAEWEPRFVARGYEVVVIDQENQGINRAVYNGMLRADGDYFCCVDCDDELDPDYVAAAAGHLEENPGDMWTACDYALLSDTVDDRRFVPRAEREFDIGMEGPLLAEKYLLRVVPTMTWFYMVRMSYFKACRVLEEFPRDAARSCQEPAIFFPLAVGGGRLKYIPRPLYLHNLYGRAGDTTADEHASKISHFFENFLELYRLVIERLHIGPAEKQRLLSLHELCGVPFRLNYLRGSGTPPDVEAGAAQLAALAERMFVPAPHLDPGDIARAHLRIFSHALACNILGIALPDDVRRPEGRVVGYGALGAVARDLLPSVCGSPLRPDVFWDAAAAAPGELCGAPLCRPDWDSLSPRDTVLVFPRTTEVVSLWKTLPQRQRPGACLFYGDILACLAADAFPRMKTCVFIG